MRTQPESSAPPRLLLVANTAWYMRKYRARLVERLEAQGCQITLCTPPDADANLPFFSQRRYVPLRLSRKGLNPFWEAGALLRTYLLLRRERPDLVLTWTPKPNLYTGVAGRLLRIPVVPNVSGLGAVFVRNGWLARVVGLGYRIAFAKSPRVFFQNEDDRATFADAGWVPRERSERLPGSGVDLEAYRPAPLPAGEFTFLFLGRLLADKGLRELVAAARMLRDEGRRFVLRIAGTLDKGNPAAISDAEWQEWIREGIAEPLGMLEDVRPALLSAHCVVLPSYREGLPRSLLEAAATARPVITTDAVGCRNAVDAGKSGFLCKVADTHSLAECMRRMLDLSPAALSEMGHAGRAWVERHFSEEDVLNVYLRVCAANLRVKPAWNADDIDTLRY